MRRKSAIALHSRRLDFLEEMNEKVASAHDQLGGLD